MNVEPKILVLNEKKEIKKKKKSCWNLDSLETLAISEHNSVQYSKSKGLYKEFKQFLQCWRMS